MGAKWREPCRRLTPLPILAFPVTVRTMQIIARLLQAAGLTIPPLAMVAQLMERIRAGQMLQFLVVSVCLFTAGYLLQQFTRRAD
jgi:hypothetical protein